MRAMLAAAGKGLAEGVRRFTARSVPIVTGEALAAFLAAEAAHVAQSATYSYLRARTGFMAPRLFSERVFLDALDRTRWEAFGAVLADLFVIAEGEMRGGAPADPVREARLVALYRNQLSMHPSPPHHADGWDGFGDDLARRLEHARGAARQAPDLVAAAAGKCIFDNLPLHPDVRRPDEELVVNSVRFRVLRAFETLRARVDLAAVARDLAADATPLPQAP